MIEYIRTMVMSLEEFDSLGEELAKCRSRKYTEARYAREGGGVIQYVTSSIFYPLAHANEVYVSTRLEVEEGVADDCS